MNEKKANADSGEIRVVGDSISYSSPFFVSWTLDLREVKACGEYTNQDGPFLDDYFFAFITRPDDGWYEASFYAQGREPLLQELTKRFGSTVQCDLCCSADFKSRIWWPAELAGNPMFEYRPAPGLWGRLGLRNEQWISPHLVEFLRGGSDSGKRPVPAAEPPG